MTTAAHAPRAPRLASENLRTSVASGIALAITFAASFGGGFLAALQGGDRDGFTGLRLYVLVYFGFWIGYTLIFIAMTWHVFRRVDGATLQTWLRESESQRRARRRREALLTASGPFAAVSFTTIAVVAVLVVALVPELRRDPLVVSLAAGVVVCSWLLLVTVYTMHYAREAVHGHQLRFEGEGPPSLPDFVYLAVQISTTFSSSDVRITGTSMRRTVSAHAVVAFAFNSVIIALLVSLLIAGIG